MDRADRLADEYLSYVTTPEEYEAQAYEGASTIYGPWTGPVLQDALEEMTTALAAPSPAPTPAPVAAATFRAGPGAFEHFDPTYCGSRFALPETASKP